ncbi:hypothetical protein N8T08_007446 [Aspergillus melleus]|uniref:Uncharacterized protein n=1 Tax=Aspergillus melleus TaxID=138277 RepID=A0ACC3AXV3_9EURO|nr:hypothetical protein N8T08_007446 [Aspergillus melleus]
MEKIDSHKRSEISRESPSRLWSMIESSIISRIVSPGIDGSEQGNLFQASKGQPGEAQPRSPQPDGRHPDSAGSDERRHEKQRASQQEEKVQQVQQSSQRGGTGSVDPAMGWIDAQPLAGKFTEPMPPPSLSGRDSAPILPTAALYEARM